MSYYVGIDIGGTYVKYGVIDNQGKLVESGKIPTRYESQALLTDLKKITKTYQQTYSIIGVGVSTPGIINDEGYMQTAGAIKGFIGIQLADLLSTELGLPVHVESDGKAAAAAEKWIGNARHEANFVCLTLGTAVGGAIYINHQLYRGLGGLAGEFGLSLVGRNKSYKEEAAARYSGVVAGLCRNYSIKVQERVLEAEEIFRRRDNGDKIAADCIAEFYHDVALLVVNVAVTVAPDVILIGGGISANEAVIEAIQSAYQEICQSYSTLGLIQMPRLLPCSLHNHAGMIGAVYLLKQAHS